MYEELRFAERLAGAAFYDIADAPVADHVRLVEATLAETGSAFDDLQTMAAFFEVVTMMHFRALGMVRVAADDGLPVHEHVRSAATTIGRLVPRTRPVVSPVAALATLGLGDVDGAGEALHDAVRVEDSMAAVRPLAVLYALRGGYDVARGLLGEMPTASIDPLLATLDQIAEQSGTEPGRNEPCWCGSGRKYKVCHRGQLRLMPQLNNRLLLQRVVEFLNLTPDAIMFDALADLREDIVGPELMAELDGALVEDIAMFEGGGIRRFLTMTGDLLPPDDALLLEEWLLIGRSVFEVEAVSPGIGLSLRDIRTGDRHDVVERTASKTLQPGTFVCTRVVPEDDEFAMYGGVEVVDQAERADFIELFDADKIDPAELVERLSLRYLPPTIVDFSGDDLVFCTGSFLMPDAATLKSKLSRRYGKPEDGEWTWMMGTRVLGTIMLSVTDELETVLTVEASTEERYRKLVDDVFAMNPQAVLLDEQRRSPQELVDDGPESDEDEDEYEMSDEEAEILAEFISGYEQSWLDLSIPALNGRTPRQAAADPTTRDDVVRLIDSFGDESGPGQMNPDRLRGMLGL